MSQYYAPNSGALVHLTGALAIKGQMKRLGFRTFLFATLA
jgi:hypothetical protein